MHDSDAYGLLRWPLAEIAQALGAPARILRELATKSVIRGADKGECTEFVYIPRHAGVDGEPVVLIPTQVGPLWYSSRMVRDEYVRSKRGEGSRFGATPIPQPKVGIGDVSGDGASSSSSSINQSQKLDASRPVEQDADPWLIGKEWLVKRGVTAGTVGGYLGRLVRDHGRENVVSALQAAFVAEPADVKGYIGGCLRDKRPGKFDPTAHVLKNIMEAEHGTRVD